MSIEAMSLVLHHSKATGAGKLVLIGIANHQSDSGAWPAISTLAKYAAVSERRVQQILAELENAGELTRDIQQGGRGQYKTNLYWVNVSCPQDCDGTFNHRSGVKSGDTRGEIWRQSGVKPVSPEPKEEPKENLKPYAQPVERMSFEDDFKIFWAAYPRKVGKTAALKAYLKAVKVTDAQTILVGARRYADDPNRAPAFTAHAATWLNAGRWDDEPLPERPKSPQELAEEERERRERKRLADIAETAQRRAETLELEERIKANPPKRCEHDRVAVICTECARLNSNKSN